VLFLWLNLINHYIAPNFKQGKYLFFVLQFHLIIPFIAKLILIYMSHYLFLVLFSFLAFNVLDAQAQPPKPAATNTVGSNPKISSVSIKDANYPEPVKNPKTNLLVFNTNSKIVNGTGEGFYFWNGIKWLPFAKIDLAVTKKMYVDEVTEISTTAARNIIKVEETAPQANC
jgi:hypothetical protein